MGDYPKRERLARGRKGVAAVFSEPQAIEIHNVSKKNLIQVHMLHRSNRNRRIPLGNSFLHGLAPIAHDDDVVAVDAAEHGPGALFQKVRVDVLGAEERDATLPLDTFGLEVRKLPVELGDLDGQSFLGVLASIPAMRMVDEIGGESSCPEIETERDEKSGEATLDDHGRQVRP